MPITEWKEMNYKDNKDEKIAKLEQENQVLKEAAKVANDALGNVLFSLDRYNEAIHAIVNGKWLAAEKAKLLGELADEIGRSTVEPQSEALVIIRREAKKYTEKTDA